jgi:hypothetical protein
MSEADFIKLAQAYRRSELRTAATFRNLWQYGCTRPPVTVEFCAADFVLSAVEVL